MERVPVSSQGVKMPRHEVAESDYVLDLGLSWWRNLHYENSERPYENQVWSPTDFDPLVKQLLSNTAQYPIHRLRHKKYQTRIIWLQGFHHHIFKHLSHMLQQELRFRGRQPVWGLPTSSGSFSCILCPSTWESPSFSLRTSGNLAIIPCNTLSFP